MAQNTNQEHGKDAEYLLPEPQKEVDRLTANDSVFAYAMKNKRVLAPLDMTKPGLKVLDSGTADGLFLRSIEPLLAKPCTLSGYDIMPSFFARSHPPHFTYGVHNLAEPWPVDMHGQFDLVHQRFAIPGCGKTATPRQSVGFLSKLVAPGGWIQLGEMDVKKPAKGGQAITDAMVLMRTMFKAVCGSDSFAYDMTDWLREEGFEDVTEEVFEVPLGPLCDDPVIGQRGAETGVQSYQAVLGAVQKFKLEVDESVTDNIIERLTDELNRDGGAYNLRFVYGRAPSRK
ncbi:hypothetical protein F4778DRAFT_800852 [Xylariomycetidae sp. FL2044]|nr:hypothetical protein F4778DRAFT_800852 [Xylariomycetidae sp. FL2044]